MPPLDSPRLTRAPKGKAPCLDPPRGARHLARVALSVLQTYERLLRHYGPQGWWPTTARGGIRPLYRPGTAGTVPGPRQQWEIVVGSILTQNTAWRNASAALSALIRRRVLSLRRMAALPLPDLAAAIHSAGYFNQKARNLQELAAHLLAASGGRIAPFLSRPATELRAELLARRGVGPETADSILLYAAGRPSFVVDAYTRRIAARLAWVPEDIAYHPLQEHLESRLPQDTTLYNEYHALLVRHAVAHCRARPLCEGCCLRDACPAGGALASSGDIP